ncbi:MAG: beta-lactamase family protein [bacterium]|nr:beta-lactamase family protein [bacterium]
MKIETYIDKLIGKGVFPGISILAGQGDSVRFKRHYGWKSLLPQMEPLHEDTLYDVASLTKPLITALLILHLVETGAIKPDTIVKSIFPDLHRFGDMNLVHLLTHTSGLPAWYPLYLFGDEYLSRFPAIPLTSRPGKRVNYSCPGYILLYYIIEKVAGVSFKQFAHDVIIGPLGLKNTFLQVPEELRANAAPTEKGNRYVRAMTKQWAKQYEGGSFWESFQRFQWREEMIQGETHDLYSHHLGGTAGNAGLFATTGDIFHLCREFYPDTATILSKETLELCWHNFTPFKKSHRTLGFKRNSSLIATGGRAFSRKAIGHNGFTGTSMWLDRWHKSGKDTTIIMLTNMVHPEVTTVRFDGIRKKLHRLINAELNREPG